MEHILQQVYFKSRDGSKTEVFVKGTRRHNGHNDADKDETSVVPSGKVSRGEKRRWSYKPSPHMFPADPGSCVPSYLSNTVDGLPRKISCVSILEPPLTIEWTKRNRQPSSVSNDCSYPGSPSLALSRRYQGASSHSLGDGSEDRIVPSRDVISVQIPKEKMQRLLSLEQQYHNDSCSTTVPWKINNIPSLLNDLHTLCALEWQLNVNDDECSFPSADFANHEGSSNLYDREPKASYSGWPVTHDYNAVSPTQERSPYPLQDQALDSTSYVERTFPSAESANREGSSNFSDREPESWCGRWPVTHNYNAVSPPEDRSPYPLQSQAFDGTRYVKQTIIVKLPDRDDPHEPDFAVYDIKHPIIDPNKIRSRNDQNGRRRCTLTELGNMTKAQIQLQNLEDVELL